MLGDPVAWYKFIFSFRLTSEDGVITTFHFIIHTALIYIISMLHEIANINNFHRTDL